MAETLTRLRSEGSYQFDFTNAPPPTEPPAWLRSISEFLGSLFSGLGPVFTVLFWAAVAALIAFLLYMLVPAIRDWVDAFVFRRKQRDETEDAEDWHPSAESARNLLAEADALAAEGRFGDAVHLLLGRSLEDIDRRRPGLLKPAMTSRVIAVEPALPPPINIL
jgi:predicted lipid-binding transport protein (Tim44 family)